MSQPLWSPTPEQIERANVTAFQRLVEEKWQPGLDDFHALYNWSIRQRPQFWQTVWEYADVIASRPWDEVLVDGDRMPGAKWFVGAKLNFAENLLRYRDDQPALVFWNERGRQRALTYAELYDTVARLASALRQQGIGPGDRVAGFMPNLPETICAMLAATSLGAIWSSCSPDFGTDGILDRFGQIEPKVLFAVDGYLYNGKTHDTLARVNEVAGQLPSLERVVIVSNADGQPELGDLPHGVRWDDYLAAEGGDIEFAQLPFDHPVYILYSSGTTGKPKCIVHGAGGTLLQHAKELRLHTDLSRDDRIFYFTTCGWMMWNWLVSSLCVGATVLLYDGSPFAPDGNILFDLADAEGMTVFGTSAKYISAVEKAGLVPRETHDLSTVRAMLSTGSPLAGEGFDFVYQKIKSDLCLSSISGGTDIVSCFALGCPVLPVWRGELQTRGLGMKVEVFGDDGRPVRGEKGELVCTAPFPSMPVQFWNDPDGAKYHAAYFDVYPNVWRHGDWAELTEHEGMVIYGRSDATLNPGGVRIGTAEIYRVVEQLDEILESLVVGQEWAGDTRIVLFVRLRDGVTLDDALIDKVRSHIRQHCTPRHVPAKVIAVPDIPRTKSGKIVELAVRELIHGRPVKNMAALANPGALEFFKDRPELGE